MAPASPRNSTTSKRAARVSDVHLQAVRLARGLSTELDRALEPLGLSLREYTVLDAVARAPGSPQMAIARASLTDRSVLVGVLDDLEGRKLLTRISDPRDRRVRLLHASSHGIAQLERCRPAVAAVERRIVGGLSTADRDVFLRVIAKISAGPQLAGPDAWLSKSPGC